MEFTVTRTSDWEYEKKMTFNTLEELAKWQQNVIHQIIIDFTTMIIEIYDDYRE